jgi:hypothetical protein
MALIASARADTTWILDGVNGRVTAFLSLDKPAAAVSWRIPAMGGAYSAIRVRDGSLIVNAHVPTMDEIGLPLHRLTADGRRISFGAEPATFVPSRPGTNVRAIAPAASGGFWATRYERYLIEQFDSVGRVVQTLERSPPWFPPGDGSMNPPNPDRPPFPHVKAIDEDEVGRLWVLIQVADPQYQKALHRRENVRSVRESLWEITDYDRFYDTVIEVLDPGAARLLASERVDPTLIFWLNVGRPPMLAAGLRLAATGHQLVSVFEVDLAGK